MMRRMARREQPAQLDLVLGEEPADFEQPRADKRELVVEIVEYSSYPRTEAGQRMNVGYTRNTSNGGMCINSKVSKQVGDLLRVTVRRVDGSASYEGLARVAWCEPRGESAYWIGVAKLQDTRRRMRMIDGRETAPQSDRLIA